MSFEKAMKAALEERQDDLSGVTGIYYGDVSRVKDECFIQIVQDDEQYSDLGDNLTQAVTQKVCVIVMKKIKDSPDARQEVAEIKNKVVTILKQNRCLVSVTYPDGFLKTGCITHSEAGKTTHHHDKFRYNRIFLEGKFTRR